MRRAAPLGACAAICLVANLLSPPTVTAQQPRNLTELTLEQLLEVEVTSVSRKPQTLVSAPAALFVLTRDDVRRSGLSSLPELLRLVPGVQVARYSNSKWSVSARGMGVYYSSKLLVLIDGRSVYTPDFAGVYWDLHEVPLEDIERIEVVRGPGGTMWGANAVNGVINIITKSAADTPGGLASVTAGTSDRAIASLRYGGDLAADVSYRLYGKFSDRRNDVGDALDDTARFARSGFRIDRRGPSSWTIQGDAYRGSEHTPLTQPALGAPYFTIIDDSIDAHGINMLARWSRSLNARGDVSVKAYFDHYSRDEHIHPFTTTAADLDVQHRIRIGHRHDVVWGAEFRRTVTRIENTEPVMRYEPSRTERDMGAGFIQDEIAVTPAVSLIVGTKAEYHETIGLVVQPNTRALWVPRSGHRVWGGVSRGVRTPSLADQIATFDYGVLPPTAATSGLPVKIVVAGNIEEKALESVVAYETGYRAQFSPNVAVDVAAFYNRYDHLSSYKRAAPVLSLDGGVPHLRVVSVHGKLTAADTHGLETLVNWTPTTRWSLSSSATFLDVNLRMTDPEVEGGNSFLVLSMSPRTQFTARSSTQLSSSLDVDVVVLWNGAWQQGDVDGYWRTDVRGGWQLSRATSIDVGVQNLFNDEHRETALYLYHTPTAIARSASVRLLVHF